MNERSSIFGNLNAKDFKPKTEPPSGPGPEDIDRISDTTKFRSREANREANVGQPLTTSPQSVSQQSSKRPPMVYRTGRNTTFSAKTTPETVEAFYEIARAQGWKAGETFERAVEALKRQVG